MDSLLDRLTMKARGMLASVRPIIQRGPAGIPMGSRGTGLQFEQFAESTTPRRESSETPTHEKKETATPVPQILAQTHSNQTQRSSKHSTEEPEQPAQRVGRTGAERAVEEVIGAMLPKRPSSQVSPGDTHEWRSRSLPKEVAVTPKEGAAASGREVQIRHTAAPLNPRGMAPMQEQPREQRPPRAQRQERAETTQEERGSEIRISIGTIELRAPRVENKPGPPAFRPRVSLDDFLNRKPEGKA